VFLCFMYSTLVQPGPGGAPGDCLSPLHPYSDAGFARDCAICFFCVGEVCNKVKSDKQFTSGGSADVELSRPLHPPPPPRGQTVCSAQEERGGEEGERGRGRRACSERETKSQKTLLSSRISPLQAYTHFARPLPLCLSLLPLSHSCVSVHTRTYTQVPSANLKFKAQSPGSPHRKCVRSRRIHPGFPSPHPIC
jgi:hypothetical protein